MELYIIGESVHVSAVGNKLHLFTIFTQKITCNDTDFLSDKRADRNKAAWVLSLRPADKSIRSVNQNLA